MKKLFLIVALLLVASLSLSACSALPETSAVLTEAGVIIMPTLDIFFASVLRPLMAMFGLIMLNFFLGVLAAVRDGTFQWNRIADYFGKYFLKNVLGWLVAEFLVIFIPAIFPELPEWLDAAAVLVLRASVFSSMLGSILEKGITLFGLWNTAFAELLGKIGIPVVGRSGDPVSGSVDPE